MASAGRGVLAASIVLVAVGYATGYVELVVLGVAGLGALGLGAAFVASTPTLTVERRLDPARVGVGGLAEGVVTITNVGRRPSPRSVGHERVGAGTVELAVPRLRPGQAVTVRHELPTGRRAVLPVGPLVLSRTDPFGLWARHDEHGGAVDLHVHPRTWGIGPLPRARHRDQEGITEGRTGGDRAFHSLREYVIGDDLRRVHWKATAHLGTLMVREHVDPARPDATVILDDRAVMLAADAFERAVEIAASVVLASRERGFPVRLRTVSGREGVGDGGLDRTALLDRLAAVDQCDGGSPVGVGTDVGAGRALVVVTGVPDPGALRELALAARRVDAVVVVAVIPPDATPPAAPPGVTMVAAPSVGAFVTAWDRLR